MTAADFQGRLREFLIHPDRHAGDVVVVYYTGHGVLDRGNLLLPMADATADIEFSAMSAAELTGKVLGGRVIVQRLLFLLDTCHAAAAGRAMTGSAIAFLDRLKGLAVSPSIAIVVASRPNESAGSGAFTRAFAEAVDHRSSGGHEPEFLALDGLVNIVNDTTPDWQHARLFLTGDGITEFVPNPRLDRWLRDLDLRTQALHKLRAARRAEERDHVLPRAQGLDLAAGNEDLWLFTGRHRALEEVCGWLRSPSGPATTVVTGGPGSGKSALLARLFVLADARLRARVPRLDTLPETTLPSPGSITRFIHARGLTADELMAGLCEACGVEETNSPGQLLSSLKSSSTPIVVIVDAIDEAAGRPDTDTRSDFPVVDHALAPLVQAAARTPLRLLLGTRRHLVPALGERARLIDLDDDTYADPSSVITYVRSCLVHLVPDSPYRRQPQPYLTAVAKAIAYAAGTSFLVALITARSLALRAELADPGDRNWRKGLPRLAADAMRQDLDQRLGELADKARDLLRPLAYAEGAGLPWEDIWPALARALSRVPYTSADIDWLIETAGYYIIESTSDDGRRSAYRLYHEALAEHLRSDQADAAAHAAIVDTLISHAPRLTDGRTDWYQAHPYTRANLASHAAAADQIDSLVTDPRFLLAAARSPLMAALPAAITRAGRVVGDAYERADPRMRASPPSSAPRTCNSQPAAVEHRSSPRRSVQVALPAVGQPTGQAGAFSRPTEPSQAISAG